MQDSNIAVYRYGFRLFCGCVEGSDLLSSKPLECAYFWALSCRSAVNGQVKFLRDRFFIKCDKLVPGRLFPGTVSSDYDISFLEKGTMYYVDENPPIKPSHPLADLFFVTEDNELVLVDVGGGSRRNIASKVKALKEWIKTEQPNVPDYKLRGVVLAPNYAGERESHSMGDVALVCGEDAISLLGGLGQIVRWME